MKKGNNISKCYAKNGEKPKLKERHIVSWSQEEDDILREQIRIHGAENWAIIASKFKDKTTRQCRRRWFTYLNSDFKKGGWSPEEDMLLCEAQKMFGNRWTEIAKVVSGRTDNAVKNRFTTLCKKRAKQEALAKQSSITSYINLNNKRVIFPTGLGTDSGSESAACLKKIRTSVSNITGNCNQGEKIAEKSGIADHLLRSPFAEKTDSYIVDFPNQLNVSHTMEASVAGSTNNQIQGTFLKKDDPKVLALIQQAELLSSLAIKVNSDKIDCSIESAWTVLKEFLKQSQENDLAALKISESDLHLEQFKDLVEDLRSSHEGSGSSWKETGMCESSPDSSDYSTGSTMLSYSQDDKMVESQPDICMQHQETRCSMQSNQLDDQHCLTKENGMQHTENLKEENNMLLGDQLIDNSRAVCEYSNSEFSSPLHVTPFFRALAAAIPSPKFSESEKNFLMKTLGMDSNSTSSMTNPSQPPPCKRSLLHCL